MSEHGPSTTAAVIASTLLLLRDDPELGALAEPRAERAVEAAVRNALPVLGQLLDRVPWPVLRRAARVAETAFSPGFVTHYALRKHGVRTHVRGAVELGAKQVVLVGAGFDMMAASVPRHVKVFEVDHPATQRLRRDAIEDRDVTFVAVDLAQSSMHDALAATPAFEASADTVFVAEGLLMYLAPARVNALLADMVRGDAPRRVVITSITPDRNGRLRLHSQRRAVDWCMRWLEEPFVWGQTRADLVRTLERHGLRVESVDSSAEIGERLLPAGRDVKPTGELIVLATRLSPSPPRSAAVAAHV